MGEKKVLLIDDEEDFLELMGSRIKGWGYDLITALNCKESIDALRNEKPDIVILDYVMPDMDGLEVLKGIRAINRKIPVIMFTAYPDERSIRGTEDLGVAAYIPKLSVYSDVHTTLKAALDMAKKELNKEED